MNAKMIGSAALAVALFAVPASGHHSHAMFDDSQTVQLDGTVKVFEWTNPHTWLQVMVANEQGQEVEWSLELGSPANLARRGWKPRMILPGDKVSVTIHPLRDGNPGGALLSVVLPNGETMGEPEYTN